MSTSLFSFATRSFLAARERPAPLLLAVGLVVSMLGCGDKRADGTSGSAPSASAAKNTAAETAKPAELIDIELGSADPKWKGWTAKGPSGAEVLPDGVEGARIASKVDNFDMAFAWGKTDLKSMKKNLDQGAESSGGKLVLTFTSDTPELLEWKSSYDGGPPSYSFIMHMKVENTDVSCKNNWMMGTSTEAAHKQVMEACKTLAKKQ